MNKKISNKRIKFALLGSQMISGLYSAGIHITKVIAPLKFESQFTDRPYISSILKDKYSIFNYLDTEQKLSEKLLWMH